jgi:hypothetical protein
VIDRLRYSTHAPEANCRRSCLACVSEYVLFFGEELLEIVSVLLLSCFGDNSEMAWGSVGCYARVPNRFAPLDDFGFDVSGEISAAAADRGERESVEPFPDIGVADYAHHFGVQLVEYRSRSSVGRDNAAQPTASNPG